MGAGVATGGSVDQRPVDEARQLARCVHQAFVLALERLLRSVRDVDRMGAGEHRSLNLAIASVTAMVEQ